MEKDEFVGGTASHAFAVGLYSQLVVLVGVRLTCFINQSCLSPIRPELSKETVSF